MAERTGETIGLRFESLPVKKIIPGDALLFRTDAKKNFDHSASMRFNEERIETENDRNGERVRVLVYYRVCECEYVRVGV